jgi:Retinal pigment epithelial membrane protein
VSATQAAYALGLKTAEDHPDPIRLSVAGQIPDWLKGALLRTAPARFEVGRTGLTHWFDGHAMLHRFAILKAPRRPKPKRPENSFEANLARIHAGPCSSVLLPCFINRRLQTIAM